MTYSLSLFDYTAAEEAVPRLAEAHRAGKYVDGKVKVLQAFHAELLTARGSVRFDPAYGSDFTSALGVTNLHSVQDVERLVSTAAATVVSNMQSRYRGNEPAEERIASASLLECRQHLDRAEADIQLMTAAGEPVILKLPVSFTNA